MLNIEDYEPFKKEALRIVKGTRRNPLQLAKYYLADWGEFERTISNLHDIKLNKAKTLFTTLKSLTEKERAFLAAKYRVVIVGKRSKPDKEMAGLYDMQPRAYAKLRTGIEYKFFCYLVDHSDTVRKITEDKIYI